MYRISGLFLMVFIFFISCDDKVKKVVIPGEIIETPAVQKDSLEEESFPFIEEIAVMANKGELFDVFSNIETERKKINIEEEEYYSKTIWLNKNENNEVRIELRPKDTTTVFRIIVEGKENKIASRTGVKTGISIEEMNAINKIPVDFYGFNWDLGGMAKFNSGSLENKNLQIFFKTEKKIPGRFKGDLIHTFEESKEAQLELFVEKIIYTPSKNNQL